MEERHARHAKLNEMVHEWVEQKWLCVTSTKTICVQGITCVQNNRDIDVAGFVKALKNEKN